MLMWPFIRATEPSPSFHISLLKANQVLSRCKNVKLESSMLYVAFSVIVKTLQTFVFSFTTDADVVRTVVFESITITMLRCDCCPAPIPGTGDAELLPPHTGPWPPQKLRLVTARPQWPSSPSHADIITLQPPAALAHYPVAL